MKRKTFDEYLKDRDLTKEYYEEPEDFIKRMIEKNYKDNYPTPITRAERVGCGGFTTFEIVKQAAIATAESLMDIEKQLDAIEEKIDALNKRLDNLNVASLQSEQASRQV